MSDPLTHPYAFGLPEGRLLDESGEDRLAEGVVFNISMFPRATAKRIEAARKYIRDIPDERLDRSVDPWRDRETGEEFELVRSFFNIVAPAESGAVAFVVSDGNLIGLSAAGHEPESKSTFIGNLGGGRAT